MQNLPHGLYEALLDEELHSILLRQPELRSVFGKLDPEEEPTRYAAFVARVVEKALRLENDPLTRLRICNELVERIAARPSAEFLKDKRLVYKDRPVLLEITPPHYAEGAMPRPETALTESTLFTGSPSDPQLVQDYPISRDLLHWETQSQTSQASDTGQTLIHHSARGYTMLFFARARKKINGVTEPFTFLGPAQIVSYQSERPIRMVWRLDHPMPAEMFEDNRRGG